MAAPRANPELTNYLVANTMMRRIGQSEELAGVALVMISPEWSFVTAQVVEVSGGLIA